ncbi:HEAT repeat-containing protein 4 isoform X2 [Sminthopsis crassicaudata]|uniref:HEAT repeat-containing protein 4 isoform X2 n=1 Tax=Sminthopsis crassicaudata TaxID=9301 RepID=UPI003D690C7F
MQAPDSAASNSQDKHTCNRLGYNPAFYHLKSGNKHDSFSGVPSVSPSNSRHCARLKKQYLKQASADFSFSKEVLQQWGLPSLSFSQYNFDHIYSTENIVSKGNEFQARKAPKFSPQLFPSLMDLPPLPALQPITKGMKGPKKYKPRHSRKESSPSDALARSFSCPASEIMESQSTILEPTTDWKGDQRDTWLKPAEKEARGWENIVLKKLSKRTARWIQNKKVQRTGGKWQNYLKHQYDWSHIRDELSSPSDLELVAQLEAEEIAELEGVDAGTSTLEGNKPELLLPVYFRIPAYLPLKKKPEITVGTNKTVEDIITERSLLRVPPVQKFQQINPRAGKYAYSTDNAFEQEIYFDLIHIIHQSGMKDDEIVLENLNHYCKHLPKAFPKGPEEWNYEPQLQRAIRWQDATVEGLLRDLKNVQDEVKIDAIITCASAAVERPRFEVIVEDSDSEEIIDSQSVDEIPKELQPLIKEALTHEKANVRMAAALCHYAIRAHDSQAQDIMQYALAKGNDADSWAAAQCLALDGVASFAVVKRILFQLFYKKDKETEEQTCLLLSHLSNKTSMIHTLLAVELNSCQWEDRIVACRALSRISGRSVNQDLKNKLVQLMWNDWNWGVRQAAAQTLGRMKLGKEVHDKIRTMLGQGNSQDRVDALSLIGWLKLMTAKLLPDFLNCFNDDFVAVRREACLAAGALRIKDKMVSDSLMKLVHSDPYWKIKAFAIRALGMIGQVSPQLIDLLLWAIHYEDEPGVRLEACRSIIALQLQGDQIRDIFLDVLLLESHEAVLREINTAMKILNLKDRGNQVMLQLIKNKISELNQKDLIINKIMKTEEIAQTIRQETKYIYQSRTQKDKPSHFVDFFKDAFQDPDVPFTLSPSDTCDMKKALEHLPTSPVPNAYSKSPVFEKKIPKRLILNKRLKTIREKRIALGPFHKPKYSSKIE